MDDENYLDGVLKEEGLILMEVDYEDTLEILPPKDEQPDWMDNE